MALCARFVHVNLIAQDWRRLARFYEDVFGCTPVPPERALGGKWLDDSTGVSGAQIQGMHLRLPGYGDQGPSIEIFQYSPESDRAETAANRPGYTHIAFAVDDVRTAQAAVLSGGGGVLGEVVSTEIPGAGAITFAYVTDPEGNIIELQRWSR